MSTSARMLQLLSLLQTDRCRPGPELAERLEISPRTLRRRWYFVAYDLTRHDCRSFRLDRLTDAQPTGARFRPRHLPAADAGDFVRAGIDNVPARDEGSWGWFSATGNMIKVSTQTICTSVERTMLRCPSAIRPTAKRHNCRVDERLAGDHIPPRRILNKCLRSNFGGVQ